MNQHDPHQEFRRRAEAEFLRNPSSDPTHRHGTTANSTANLQTQPSEDTHAEAGPPDPVWSPTLRANHPWEFDAADFASPAEPLFGQSASRSSSVSEAGCGSQEEASNAGKTHTKATAATFPVDVFPRPLARFVREAAAALPGPVDFIAVPMLAVLGTATCAVSSSIVWIVWCAAIRPSYCTTVSTRLRLIWPVTPSRCASILSTPRRSRSGFRENPKPRRDPSIRWSTASCLP